MTVCVRKGLLPCLGSVVALLLLAATVWAAEGRKHRAKLGDYNPADPTVEMFAAIEKGDIAVKLIPKDSTQCRVLIENKTDKPLNVKLPETFAGVPALAQFDDFGGGRRGGRDRGGMGGGMNQSMGGGMGMGGMGMGGRGMGGGMGMFNVPPEKVGQLKVTTVCLEHGKREPRAAVPYEIKPLESLTAKPGVRELCVLLGSGQIDQRAAQAAAWHLNNGMSWQELAAKQLRFANGTSRPYFSPQEIRTGMNIAMTAVKIANERQKPATSPGESVSQY